MRGMAEVVQRRSSAGSTMDASVVSSGSSSSRCSAFIAPKMQLHVRRPPSPTASSASYSSRRESRAVVHPNRQAALVSALGQEAGDSDEDCDVQGPPAVVYGLMNADEARQNARLLRAAKGARLAEGEALQLPEKRDPDFQNAVLKHLYSQHPELVTLDMSDCDLHDYNMPRLADGIATNTVLRSLSLATNALTHECMPDLVQAVLSNQSLRSLDLSENAVGVRGAALLARHLAEKTRLIGLDLSSNLIRDEGCRAVLDSLQQTPGVPLQWLSVSENQISDHSAADVASIIDLCQNLTFLDLSRNSFFSNGMRVIAEELGLNKTLRHLNISNITLGSDAVELVAGFFLSLPGGRSDEGCVVLGPR